MSSRTPALFLLLACGCVDATVIEEEGCSSDADCPADSLCIGAACVPCGGGKAVCSGACFDLALDPTNCGGCGTVCSGLEVCAGGSCGCDTAGTGDCGDGAGCRSLVADVESCGGCGVVCGLDEECVNGACRCPEGQERGGAAGCCGATLPVEAGPFTMGCDDTIAPDCEALDYILETVTLGEFRIDLTEVSQEAWRRCSDRGGCGLLTYAEGYDPGNVAGYPVIATWAEADGYCRWLGKRLPSSAEWERAARGTDARLYPWGNEEPDCTRANLLGCMEVGSMEPVVSHEDDRSPVGALNMAGNIAEWVSDDHLDSCDWDPAVRGGPAPHGTVELQPGEHCKQGRGGDSKSPAISSQTFRKFSLNPGWPIGFRCAQDP